ncbi:MAG: TolC family protein [Planctomycetes bacterium]|nr:TolC family protein [Planctomycetota bacterium]
MMRLVFTWVLVLCLTWVTGCSSTALTDERPQPGPLAHDVPTFQTPKSPEAVVHEKVEPAGDLSLQQALSLALLHNPQLEASAWQLSASEAAILQNTLGPNPVLGLKVENVGGEGTLSAFDGAMTTLRVSQAIELGQKRTRRTRLARHEYTRSAWDYEARRLNVIGETGRRYIDVLARQQELDLAQHALELATGLHVIVTDRIRQGVAPTSELDKTLVQVTAREIDLENKTQQLKSSRQSLAAMWGSNATQFSQVGGQLSDIHDIPALDDLMGLVHRNPDVARWPTEIALRKAAVDVSTAKAYPNLTVGGGMRRFNATHQDAYVFELGMPLPLIDRNQGAIRRARFDLLTAKALKRDAETTVHTKLNELHNTLCANRHAVTALRDRALPAARSAFSAAQKAFKHGVTDYINVLDAERTLLKTQYNYVDALAAYHKTLITLEAFLGTPVPGGQVPDPVAP